MLLNLVVMLLAPFLAGAFVAVFMWYVVLQSPSYFWVLPVAGVAALIALIWNLVVAIPRFFNERRFSDEPGLAIALVSISTGFIVLTLFLILNYAPHREVVGSDELPIRPVPRVVQEAQAPIIVGDSPAAPGGDSPIKPSPFFSIQTVYYVTDRAASAEAGFFNKTRGKKLSFGWCEVSVPYSHVTGELERPKWIMLQFRDDPRRDMVLQAVRPLKSTDLLRELNYVLASTVEQKLLLFIHGYNVSFTEAALRTAQLAYDLDLRGADSRGTAVFYSWPSQGMVIPYQADESNAEWAQDDMFKFLKTFLASTSARKVFVLAHSMGSRPTLRAIANLAQSDPGLVAKIQGVILAAPDIDADTFRREIAPIFGVNRLQGTLYVSSRDRPLNFSMKLHGGYPRLGDPAAGPIVVPGIETIDASEVDNGDFWGHSYFADRSILLEDIFTLLNGSTAGARFDLTQLGDPGARYWKFRASH
jgi:esterase/lipase superfamily enzyme